MERKIKWESGILDEIDLVYEKADKDENLSRQLRALEADALDEAKANCGKGGLLEAAVGAVLTPEQFDAMSCMDQETAIKCLAGFGLTSFGTDISSAVIKVRFSAHIQKVLACTIFDVLNRLEKLDGSINIIHPKWTLELQVPLGGKKGLFQWEMMIMQMYSWISVHEVSSKEIADQLTENTAKGHTSVQKGRTPSGKPENASNDSVGSGVFLREMQSSTAFMQAFKLAGNDVKESIKSGFFSAKVQNQPMTAEMYDNLTQIEKLNCILMLGNHGITKSAVLCVDFSEKIPYCVAMMLLYGAYTGQMKKQIIDAGDGANVDRLVEALTLLHSCCDGWECTIMYPTFIKIGTNKAKTTVNEAVKTQPVSKKKESFWKKLFR